MNYEVQDLLRQSVDEFMSHADLLSVRKEQLQDTEWYICLTMHRFLQLLEYIDDSEKVICKEQRKTVLTVYDFYKENVKKQIGKTPLKCPKFNKDE